MRSIYLIACVSKKRSSPIIAELMYQSDWFLKARAYAKTHADSWYILSAKYGLLSPQTLIEPYDKTLAKGMLKAERIHWAEQVYKDLLSEIEQDDKLIFLAGNKYREYLVPKLEESGYQVEIPMLGLGIGQQLAWLKSELVN